MRSVSCSRPSPRQVTPQAVDRIINRLPREILTVGVFRDESPKRVVQIVNSIGLRAAQLHGSESASDTSTWPSGSPARSRRSRRAIPTSPRSAEFGARAVLVDGASPGSGEVFEWRLAEGVVDPSRLIVSGGLNAGNVGDAIAHLRPLGVDVSSGVEASPGARTRRRSASSSPRRGSPSSWPRVQRTTTRTPTDGGARRRLAVRLARGLR